MDIEASPEVSIPSMRELCFLHFAQEGGYISPVPVRVSIPAMRELCFLPAKRISCSNIVSRFNPVYAGIMFSTNWDEMFSGDGEIKVSIPSMRELCFLLKEDAMSDQTPAVVSIPSMRELCFLHARKFST